MSAEKKVFVRRLIFVLLSLAVAVLIFWFSHQPAEESSGDSRSFIMSVFNVLPVLSGMTEGEKLAIIGHIHSFVRKTAHFSIYAVLGICVVNWVVTYVASMKKALFYSAAVCFFYACTDEFHQLFIPGRSGELRDVLIDTCGAVTGILVVFLCMFIFEKIKRRKIK